MVGLSMAEGYQKPAIGRQALQKRMKAQKYPRR
jgi:hypothetical protein